MVLFLVILLRTPQELNQIWRHVTHRLQVTHIHLQLEDLLEVHLLHLADFICDFKISILDLCIPGWISKDFIELEHSILKRLYLQVLCLDCDVHMVKLSDELIDLGSVTCIEALNWLHVYEAGERLIADEIVGIKGLLLHLMGFRDFFTEPSVFGKQLFDHLSLKFYIHTMHAEFLGWAFWDIRSLCRTKRCLLL